MALMTICLVSCTETCCHRDPDTRFSKDVRRRPFISNRWLQFREFCENLLSDRDIYGCLLCIRKEQQKSRHQIQAFHSHLTAVFYLPPSLVD